MFENLTDKLERSFQILKGEGRITEINVAESLKDNPELFNLPESRYTVDGLVDFFVQSMEGSRKILPKEKRRYVIYLRKSTDDERKQVRSIDD